MKVLFQNTSICQFKQEYLLCNTWLTKSYPRQEALKLCTLCQVRQKEESVGSVLIYQ